MSYKQLSLSYRQKLKEIARTSPDAFIYFGLVREAKELRDQLRHMDAVSRSKRYTLANIL